MSDVMNIVTGCPLSLLQTLTEIKEMKNEYAEKKLELKKQMKQMLKDDEKKLQSIKKSGQDMIEYLKMENAKLQEKHAAMKHEYSLLEKQFDLLTMKSDEISNNFTSLQGYVSFVWLARAVSSVVDEPYTVHTKKTMISHPTTTTYANANVHVHVHVHT